MESMKSIRNFIFIGFLMVAVIFLPTNYAHAKGALNILNVIILVAVVFFAPYISPFLAAIIVADDILIGLVACQYGVDNPLWSGCSKDGNSSSGAAGSPTLQNQTATPIMNADGTCTTGFTLNYETVDALQYAIYRDGNSLSQGFLGDERISHPMVSYDEYGNPEFPPDCTPDETLAYDSDGEPIYDYKYDSDGNLISKKQRVNVFTCTEKKYYSYPSPHTSNFSYTDTGLAPNKDYKYDIILVDKYGKQYRYPQLNAYSECIKLDLKANGSDEPSTVKVASNYVTLNWITEGALSCSASGDWSGSKGPATGREELGKIARGTSNPGLGKTYNYSMTCQYPKNKTLTDSGSVTVFKYPECDFSADPAVIEILPATSTLSWDCRYYGGTPDEGSDSCSINQGIGSVSPLKDSVSVRPSQETTYTLTCSTVDGTSDYQASVKIGFRPRVYEINPGAW